MKQVRNGVGMRSISRIMNIAVSTVIRKVKRIAERIKKPVAAVWKNAVEIDELRTFVGPRLAARASCFIPNISPTCLMLRPSCMVC